MLPCRCSSQLPHTAGPKPRSTQRSLPRRGAGIWWWSRLWIRPVWSSCARQQAPPACWPCSTGLKRPQPQAGGHATLQSSRCGVCIALHVDRTGMECVCLPAGSSCLMAVLNVSQEATAASWRARCLAELKVGCALACRAHHASSCSRCAVDHRSKRARQQGPGWCDMGSDWHNACNGVSLQEFDQHVDARLSTMAILQKAGLWIASA